VPDAAAPPLVTRPTSAANRRAVRRFSVTVTTGPSSGKAWAELAERCAIGSHPSNDLIVDDPTVSRFHCELSIADGRVRVRDLGSRNAVVTGSATLVDGSIAGGTTLVLGNTKLRVDIDDGSTDVELSERDSFGPLVGKSAVMRELFAQLDKVAPTEATVLIEGETGTGKEGVAEAIHDASPRARAPFVVVDCGAIPAALLESELFGHEAGAFTGAGERRIGAFEEASGGTLFLDEIGELPQDLQPKLLRALESREIRRVGGRGTIRCDLRILAATNRDLRNEVNRQRFRPDLYYRLAVARSAAKRRISPGCSARSTCSPHAPPAPPREPGPERRAREPVRAHHARAPRPPARLPRRRPPPRCVAQGGVITRGQDVRACGGTCDRMTSTMRSVAVADIAISSPSADAVADASVRAHIASSNRSTAASQSWVPAPASASASSVASCIALLTPSPANGDITCAASPISVTPRWWDQRKPTGNA
jgi:pSer/pThr/pTyr-binding forkhead associated (FHA) protein